MSRGVLRLAVVGVGGQGVVVCARLLAEAALRLGYKALMSEVHGMSQRGGIVEASVAIGFGGDGPYSPMVARQGADVLVGLEPVEALRAIGLLSRSGTAVVFTGEVPPPSAWQGGPPYPPLDVVLRGLSEACSCLWVLEPRPLAQPLRANVALIGALVRAEVLPFSLDVFVDIIPTVIGSRFVESNIESLKFGFEEAKKYEG